MHRLKRWLSPPFRWVTSWENPLTRQTEKPRERKSAFARLSATIIGGCGGIYWQLKNLLHPEVTGWKSLCLCNSDTTMELIDRVNTTFEGQLENDDLAMDYWQCCRTLGEIQKNLNLGPLRQVNCSAEVVFQRYRSWNWFSELVKGLEASLRVMLIGASPSQPQQQWLKRKSISS